MRRSSWIPLVLATWASACSDDASPASSAPIAADAGPSDALVTASDDCAPGTRAAVGTTSCVPVGPSACAPGFTKDASGWGCAAVVPPAACSGATRPALGETGCVPIGDCGGMYPPAGAIMVDPAAAVDATHVKTLSDAVAAANAGATIALVDGEHVAPFVAIAKDLTIVGRCAEKAKIVPNAGGTGGARVTARVAVRNVTFAGVTTPFEVQGTGASLTLEDAVLEASRSRAVFVRSGAKASLTRVVVRGTVADSPGAQTIAVLAGTGGVVTIADSAILDSFDAAVAAVDSSASNITLRRSIIDGTTAGAVRAFEGAKVNIEESLVRRAGGIAILALHRKTGYPKITLSRSVVAETQPAPAANGGELATAINAAFGSIVDLEETTIADTKGIGAYSTQTAKVSLTNSAVVRTTRNAQSSGHAAVATRDGELSLVSSAVFGASAVGVGSFTRGHVRLDRALVREVTGVVVQGLPLAFGINAIGGSTVDAVDSSIVDARELGIISGDRDTRTTLERVLVTRTANAKPAEFGHGVLAAPDSLLDVTGSIVEKQPGVALFYAASSGAIAGSLVRTNGIGVHVQEGTTLLEAATKPETASPLELVVTTDVAFVDNATRTGGGELPLPTAAKEE